MVLAFSNTTLEEASLAALLGTTRDGTSFESIRKVESLGFNVHIGSGTRADLQKVFDLGSPVITAVNTMHLPTYAPPFCPHSVVVIGADLETVAVLDPYRTSGPDFVPAEAFDRAWMLRRYLMAGIAPR